jgi:hypothetical protein
MAKDKKGEQPQQNTSKSASTTDFKKSQRRQQAERDRAAAVNAPGYVPKKAVEAKDRCKSCDRPSAAVRRGAPACARCQGEFARAQRRQKARDSQAHVPQQPKVPARPVVAGATR